MWQWPVIIFNVCVCLLGKEGEGKSTRCGQWHYNLPDEYFLFCFFKQHHQQLLYGSAVS